MIEAVVLCLLGSLVGIVLGVGIGNLAGSILNSKPTLPLLTIMIGPFFCILIGVIFGTYPAYKAANLDPVEA